MLAVQITLIWQWTPFMTLILLAGLQTRPGEILEAAAVDGATPWQMFTHMTLPHMRQYLELAGMLGAIYILQTFDMIFILTPLNPQTENLPYPIYQTLYSAKDYGLASAQGVVIVILTIIVATFALKDVPPALQGGEQMMSTAGEVATPAATPTRAAPENPKPKGRAGSIIAGIAAWIIGLLFIIPVVMMVLTSFHPESRRRLNPPDIFAPLTLDDYSEFFGGEIRASPWPSLINSAWRRWSPPFW